MERRRGRPYNGNKSITISIQPEIIELLDRFAELRDVSRSVVLGELLEQVKPALADTCEALEFAKANPARGVERINESLRNAMQVAKSTQEQLFEEGKRSDKTTSLAM